ncbi:MAG: carbohydrate kinase family protein [Myxococcota bacterium]
MAIDHIMVFRGRFRDVILPDRIHLLNVAFHVPELRRSFGGCAGNIAYHLRLLGEDPLLLATVGADDFDAYAAWLDRHRVRRDHVVGIPGEATAGAYITTDLDDNQIIGFHPGAMDRAHEAGLDRIQEPIDLGIVSPNGKRAMQEHARGLKERGIQTVIDPGQGLPLFEGPELIELLEGATLYVVNDYEWSLTLSTTALAEAEIVRRVGAVVVTRGEKGSTLLRGSDALEIPAVAAERVVDPTGCGDAYRAAFLHGVARGLDLEICARMGSVLGALAVAEHGTQSITTTPEAFRAGYARAFGAELP